MRVKTDDFSKVFDKVLQEYERDVTDACKKQVDKTTRMLVKLTKQKAPSNTGKYKDHIKSKKTVDTATKYGKIWYVDGKHYRLTHLLEKGYESRSVAVKAYTRKTKTGKLVDVKSYKRRAGRHRGTHFLANSIKEVLPEFVDGIKRGLKND